MDVQLIEVEVEQSEEQLIELTLKELAQVGGGVGDAAAGW
jgi:hypothetical protein